MADNVIIIFTHSVCLSWKQNTLQHHMGLVGH